MQYSPNLRALACYLVVFQHVPAERAALLIADVTGARVSTGWIARTVARTAGLPADTEAFIKTLLTLAHMLHVDETSTSIAGDTQWLHVACTDTLTAYHLHSSRGLKAVESFGVLPVFAGTVVHDSPAQYRPENFPLSRHALCGARIIRELTAAAESDPGQIWPGQALFALTSLNTQAPGHANAPRCSSRRASQRSTPTCGTRRSWPAWRTTPAHRDASSPRPATYWSA